MQNFNGSNAYKMRSTGTAPKKKTSGKKPKSAPDKRKHIRPNMTIRLNKRSETVRVKSPEGLSNAFRSFDRAQMRILFVSGFAFVVLLLFFALIINCGIKSNELTHTMQKKQEELQQLEIENQSLITMRKQIMTDSYIKEYAEHKLGMQRRENYQLKWFTVNDDDDSAD